MRLVLLGDVMLGRLVNDALRTRRPDYPWGDVLPLLREADGLVLNLECVVSDLGEPWPGKLFAFRSDLKNLEVLARAGVSAVSLANNHALDFGGEALRECLGALSRRGIGVAGAGESPEAARRPALFRAGGLTVALVAFTDNEPEWEAGERAPGVFFAPVEPGDPRFQALLRIVRAASGAADLVVVSTHWGPNWGEQPPTEHVAAGRLLVDAGADVVFGHSAHIFRGVELYRGKPILYSCGDFIDDYAVDEVERNDQSFAFLLEVTPPEGAARVTLVPTVIRRFQARLAHGSERVEIEAKMRRLCAALGTEAKTVPEGLAIP